MLLGDEGDGGGWPAGGRLELRRLFGCWRRLECECLFDQGEDRDEAASGSEKAKGAGSRFEGEASRGGQSCQGIADFEVVEKVARDLAVGYPFYGNGGCGVDAWRGRKRVAAAQLMPMEGKQEGEELSGAVEQGQAVGALQLDRLCIEGFRVDGDNTECPYFHEASYNILIGGQKG